MSIRHALLGFLSRGPASGYDLKKAVAAAGWLPWTGNSNQVYTALIALANDGLATVSTELPASGPARKVYAITATGLAELDTWLTQECDPPEWRSDFVSRLAWSDRLAPAVLAQRSAVYLERVRLELLMARHAEQETASRTGTGASAPIAGSPVWIDAMVAANRVATLEAELVWAERLAAGLAGSA